MKTSIKTIACTALVSIALLACNDAGREVNNPEPCKAKAVAKIEIDNLRPDRICYDHQCIPIFCDDYDKCFLCDGYGDCHDIDSLHPSEICFHDDLCVPAFCDDYGECIFCDNYGNCKPKEPPPIEPFKGRIDYLLEEWMDEQFAFGSKDKVEVLIYDTLAPEYIPKGGIYEYNEDGEITHYYIEGRKMSVEEYNEWLEEYSEERKERRSIGEFILEGGHYWITLVTAAEIAELAEKYEGLIIDRPSPGVTNGNDSSSPCD